MRLNASWRYFDGDTVSKLVQFFIIAFVQEIKRVEAVMSHTCFVSEEIRLRD